MSPILSKGKGLFIYGRILACVPLLVLYALPAKPLRSAPRCAIKAPAGPMPRPCVITARRIREYPQTIR